MNRGMRVLQTLALPLGYVTVWRTGAKAICSRPLLWSGRRGSNPLPPPWQGGALPDELRPRTTCIIADPPAPVKYQFQKLMDRQENPVPGSPAVFSRLLQQHQHHAVQHACSHAEDNDRPGYGEHFRSHTRDQALCLKVDGR